MPDAVPPPEPPVVETRTDDLPLEFADEEVMFRKDGTVVWRAGGVRTVLRRPKFKELRVLHEEINTLAEESRVAREPLQTRVREMSDPLQEAIRALDPEDPQNGARIIELSQELRDVQTSPEFLDLQAALRKQRDEADDALMEWFAESILRRLGRPVPRIEDVGDLPAWCLDSAFQRDLLQHWASVPRRPGVV